MASLYMLAGLKFKKMGTVRFIRFQSTVAFMAWYDRVERGLCAGCEDSSKVPTIYISHLKLCVFFFVVASARMFGH